MKMNILFKTSPIHSMVTDCIIVNLWGSKQLSSSAETLDQQLNGALSTFVKNSTQLSNPSDIAVFTLRDKELKASQLLFVNLGDKKQLTLDLFKKTLDKVATTLDAIRCKSVCFAFDDLTLSDANLTQAVKIATIAIHQATYRYEVYKSTPKPSALEQVIFSGSKAQEKILQTATKQAQATIVGMNLTMDLANCPPNICYPEYLVKQAQQLAKQYPDITTKALDEKALKKIGAGALLAVGQGSPQKPRLIIVEYYGAAKTQQPHVLVGKGITFDTGGNNLKSFEGMVGMKYDMCGAASVLGTIQAVAELKLKVNVIGLVASAENMPGGDAFRPEDIITSLSGQTIEVLNTDAEGRLVLCDALTYAERYKPKAVIDIATLTGAIVISLGNVHTGLFSNNDALAEQMQQAATTSRDTTWRLPMGEEYDAMLSSSFADIKNIAGPAAGSITAACFLARFTKKYPWVHLDVAGTASLKSGLNRKATGRPVPLLLEYLLQQVK